MDWPHVGCDPLDAAAGAAGMNYRYTPEEIGQLNAENDRLQAVIAKTLSALQE